MGNNYLTNLIQPKISFKGHSLSINEKGEKEYNFYLPAGKQKDIKAEVVLIDKNGAVVNDLTSSLKKSDGPIPVWKLPISTIQDKNVSVAYRFLYEGNSILDNTLKIKSNGKEYNEAIFSSRPPLEMPRQMYHLMPDNFNINNDKIMFDKYGNELQRNHFNKFGGTIQGIIDKLSEIKSLGAKRIISTPIFGDDRISNHGYWTANPYQITSSLGNINDYKDLQIELFKKGLGFVADGAFANEGIEGIHIQDIIRWGESSPYTSWFDMKDFSQNGLKLGVLPPAGSEAEKYYDFKLINSPLIYKFDKNGKPAADFGKINPNYDKTQPTYLQQFDRRLMDDDYINSPELLKTYTKTQLDDVNGIRNYKDSVQPLSFNIDPKTAEEKIKRLKKVDSGENSSHSLFREAMRKWDNFSLEHVDKDGTIRNWTGKKDIVALNYVNPDVQDYISGTAKYWTNETDKLLTNHVAERLAKSNGNLSDVIQKIAKQFNTELTPEEIQNMINGSYNVELAPAGRTIIEELKSFPLTASESSREINSLFSDSALKNNPKFSKVYEKNISPIVENIFKSTHPEAFNNGQLTKEGQNLFRLVSSDIMRYISAYALSGEAPKVEKTGSITKIKLPEDFDKKIFNNLNYQSSTRQETIDKLFRILESQSATLKDNKQAQSDIEKIIHYNLDGIDFKTMKIAKALISKLEAGLEWRIDAAKDIMDLDQITQNKASAENTWKVVQNFWKKFNDTVREYNPKAYTIGEVTCLGSYFKDYEKIEKEFIKEAGFTTQTNYSHIFNILNRIVHGAPEEAFGGPYHVPLSLPNPNDYSLSKTLRDFFQSGYADNIRYSHEFVDNHDKPRALHGYAVNIADFFNLEKKDKGEVNAVKEALVDALAKAKDKTGLTIEQTNKIEKAFNDYATGIVSQTTKEHFKTRPYNYIIEDAIRRADLKLDKNQTEKIVASIHNEMLKPAFSKFKSMMEILVSLPGNPTLYAGDEFGETGFETPGNNVFQHNRNQIHRNWIKDSNRPEFVEFHDAAKKIFNIRNKKYFSPFINGDTIVMEDFAGNNVGGVYRYNKEGDIIAVFNTNGLENTRTAAKITPVKVSSIPVKADFDITNAYGTNEFVRINALGEEINDGFYKLIDNSLKHFDDASCTKESKEINLSDAATYFVRKTKKAVEQMTKKIEDITEEVVENAEQTLKNTDIILNKSEKISKIGLKGSIAIGAIAFAGIGLATGLILNNLNKNKRSNNKQIDKIA